MRFTNYTNFPSEKIKEFIRFSKPSKVSKFDVQIKNCGPCGKNGVKGVAYHQGCSLHGTPDPFINVYISRKLPSYPTTTYDGSGYIGFKVYSLMEELLFVIAHELRHLWQSKVPKGYRVWGARGKFSERDADAYAIRTVRKYRKLYGVI